MGHFPDSKLREPPPSRYAIRKTVAVSLGGNGTATQLVEHARELKPSTWHYGDEIPVKIELAAINHIQLPAATFGAPQDLYWTGIEVRLLRSNLPQSCPAPHIVAALEPATFRRHFVAPLRPGLNKTLFPDWEHQLRRLAAGEIQIADLPFDPFSQDPGWLVARLGDPIRPHWLADAEPLGDGATIFRNRQHRPRRTRDPLTEEFTAEAKLPPMWRFGLCPKSPSEGIILDLFQETQGFMEDAAAGQPAFKLRPPRQTKDEASSGKKPTWEQRQGLIAKNAAPNPNLAEGLLSEAIFQGLAGRDEGSEMSVQSQISWRYFRRLFQDADQRLKLQAERKGGVAVPRKLLNASPELRELTEFGRFDIKKITQLARTNPQDPRLALVHSLLSSARSA